MNLRQNKMIQDIHSHTCYSDCGRDNPREVIEAAIAGGITHFGICDHNYGIGERKNEYLEEINSLKDEYRDRITLYCGIEIATCNDFRAPKADEDFSAFDYCLLEHVDNDNSIITDIFEFADSLGCPVGIAHTGLFEFCERRGYEPIEFLSSLAKKNIFWEMNVNCDSIHNWHQHEYVAEFVNNPEQQETVLRSGIKLSIGFDGHRVEDYDPQRIIQMNIFLQDKKIPIKTFDQKDL